MPFEPGLYRIHSLASDDHPLVGRSRVGDACLIPKPVLVLPKGSHPPLPFTFELASKGNILIKSLQDPLFAQGENLFAMSHHVPSVMPQEWKVLNDGLSGPDAYVIMKADGPEGWVAPSPNEGSHQIMIRPIITGKGFPAYYPSNEVFILEKFDL